MKWVHLFDDVSLNDQIQARMPMFAPESGNKKAKATYLLPHFSCLAVPCRADYDSAFEPYVRAGDNELPDCDSDQGFAGWFWVMHAAAPNIGILSSF